MTKRHAHRAILVLESPWGLDAADANRSSVLPFVEGVAKYAGDTEVFHANFYDKSSFEKALACLCRTRYSNTIVYIAAHGSERKIGGVNILDALREVNRNSRDYNITGVLLGACYTGSATATMEECIEGGAIRWCVGYASSASWLEGTLIDCALLSAMSEVDEEEYRDPDSLTDALADALTPFDGSFAIGHDKRDKPVALRNSLRAVIRPARQGTRAREVSSALF
jgi:hypothetical protein